MNKGFKILAIHSKEFDKIAKWFSREEPIDLIKFSDIFRFSFEIYNSVNVNGEMAHPLFKY